jgi:hypothetical protein
MFQSQDSAIPGSPHGLAQNLGRADDQIGIQNIFTFFYKTIATLASHLR